MFHLVLDVDHDPAASIPPDKVATDGEKNGDGRHTRRSRWIWLDLAPQRPSF
jgi:hypothetical protein